MVFKLKNSLLFFTLNLFYCVPLFSQTVYTDSNLIIKADTTVLRPNNKEQVYNLRSGKTFIYTKPKPFGFITNLPPDAKGLIVTSFKKENIKRLLFVGGTTVALMFADETVSNGVKQFSKNIHYHNEEEYRNIISIKAGKTNISIFKAPKNLNTAFYQMGQGFPSLLISAGLFD